MAARKGRSPVATSITPQSLEQAATALNQLPEKPKTNWSLREAIAQLQGTINTALERGYSYPEIAEMLAEQGIRISPASLKSYLAASSRETAPAPKRRRTSTKKAETEAATPAPVPAPAPAPAPAPKRGRAAAKTATTEKKTTASKAESAPEAAPAPKKTRGPRTASKAKAPAPAKTKKASTEATVPRTRRKKTGSTTAS